MIPKVINYCWFGGKELPQSARRCIASWKKYFPDFEIRQWNESNFDVNCIKYTTQAYKMGKYAFVSDYARFKILYENGGLYFDTDVEVVKSMADLLVRGPFMGRELNAKLAEERDFLGVNPGLGMAAIKGLPFFKSVLDKYETMEFVNSAGEINKETVVTLTSNLLVPYGLKITDDVQNLAGITIYPWDYFSPKCPLDGRIRKTANTYSIHHYDASWMSKNKKIKIILSNRYPKTFKFLLKIKHTIEGKKDNLP